MKHHQILWTATAVRQRNMVFDYWNNRNKSNIYSKKLLRQSNERINLLKSNPYLGKKTDFLTTRILSLGHYSILYRVINSKIVITGFWDNRQDPEKLLTLLRKRVI
jgi:hypothetical protein